MSHTLPKLSYSHDALEPHIDAKTVEIHHGKHHAGYVSKLNAALESLGSDWPSRDLEQILWDVRQVPEPQRQAVRNNGGGHLNHSLYWRVLSPGGSSSPSGSLAEAIQADFGSLDRLKEEFTQAALGRFGSGWAWLSVNQQGGLEVHSTANQDSPLMTGHRPILGIDVWEHAYYLTYQNRRPEYVEAFWQLINWDVVSEEYELRVSQASGSHATSANKK